MSLKGSQIWELDENGYNRTIYFLIKNYLLDYSCSYEFYKSKIDIIDYTSKECNSRIQLNKKEDIKKILEVFYLEFKTIYINFYKEKLQVEIDINSLKDNLEEFRMTTEQLKEFESYYMKNTKFKASSAVKKQLLENLHNSILTKDFLSWGVFFAIFKVLKTTVTICSKSII